MIFDFENASLQYVMLQMAAMKRLMEIGLVNENKN